MEDLQIVDLYWRRDEAAIAETDHAYGRKLHSLSYNIVSDNEDAKECVNDTYLKAWSIIPPEKPQYLFAFLAKICRFLSFDCLDRQNAAKRKGEFVQLTSEMELCIPDHKRQQQTEAKEIGEFLNAFLETLPRETRLIFLRRYWYGDSVSEIASRYGIGESKVKTQLHRTRIKLRGFLEKEGLRV